MPADPYAPTAHTAALLFHLRRRAGTKPPGHVVEIGTGSGVVLATLLAAGATSGFGVDVEPAAVERTEALLRREGLAGRAQIALGDMWSPCPGRRFDLAAANLPHFPAESIEGDSHPASFSCGGPDGRRWLDAFLQGLRDHLSPTGVAVITHNVFVDLERTRALAATQGLAVEIATTCSAPIPAPKFASLTPAVLERHAGHGIYRVGDHAFGDFHIVEIGRPADVRGDR